MTTDTGKFSNISQQLKALLEALVDDDNNPYFKSVILGIPNSKFRGFEFPIAIVRINKGEYESSTFNKTNTPNWIYSSIGILLTGELQDSYCYAMEIMDKIQEKFETDNQWIHLNNTVRTTHIESSATEDISTDEVLMRIVAFSLKHHVYK